MPAESCARCGYEGFSESAAHEKPVESSLTPYHVDLAALTTKVGKLLKQVKRLRAEVRRPRDKRG